MVQSAVILAGGFGTRLGGLTKKTPKPLLPLNARPFLDYLVQNLAEQGIKRVVLCAGFMAEQIVEFAKTSPHGVEFAISIEDDPLGTGGGIAKGFDLIPKTEGEVLVLNGDTYSTFRLDEFAAFHAQKKADVSIVIKSIAEAGRYGTVDMDREGKILGFREKGQDIRGLINAGVYLIDRNLFARVKPPPKFSFEVDFLQKYYATLGLYGLVSPGYFIDIGIPADYERAQRELTTLKQRH